LDDRVDRLVTPEGQAAWREWLRLSNVLGYAERPMTIAVLSQVESRTAAVSVTSTPPAAPALADLDPAWQGLVDAALSDIERALLRQLAVAGVPRPEQGFETEDGTPLDLAWPNEGICVVFDESDASVGHPWKVAQPDVDVIIALFGGNVDVRQEEN
jgi:hypothetical protein